jgi:hypothetical protein
MARVSSLLAQEEDTEAPSLGAFHAAELEQSPLERLITHSSSEQAAQNAFNFSLEQQAEPRRRNNFAPPFTPLPQQRSSSTTKTTGASIITVVAGTFSLLQIGLVWGSFLSSSWCDTYLRVSLPLLNDYTTDTFIESITLASILSKLNGAEKHGTFLLLLLTSLAMPCLCMLLGPTWTMGDHNDRLLLLQQQQQRRPQFCMAPRAIFELWMRFSFLIVFLLMIVDIGISSIQLVGQQDTNINILNASRGGLVCYTLGMCCALMSMLVLRVARKDLEPIELPSNGGGNNNNNNSSSSPIRFPPKRAFQLPWLRTSSRDDADLLQEQNEPLLQEDELLEPTTPAEMEAMQMEIPISSTTSTSSQQELSFCQKIILYEVGGLAIFLWFPALYLPLLRLSFSGLASEFMEQVLMEVRFWELPAILWQHGVAAGTCHWILFSLGGAVIGLVYLLPILATVMCVFTWMSRRAGRSYFRNVLVWLQPALCGIVFAVAVCITVPALGPLTEYILDEKTSGVCEQFKQITNEACLVLSGQFAMGGWFLLAQSISLELFVALTLSWAKR